MGEIYDNSEPRTEDWERDNATGDFISFSTLSLRMILLEKNALVQIFPQRPSLGIKELQSQELRIAFLLLI